MLSFFLSLFRKAEGERLFFPSFPFFPFSGLWDLAGGTLLSTRCVAFNLWAELRRLRP